jgi:phosphatidylethanolamine N-methyltransferase
MNIQVNDSLVQFLCVSAMIPICWNVVARIEYSTRVLTRLYGSKYFACFTYSVYVFTTSLYRDYLFQKAISKQETFNEMLVPFMWTAAPLMFIVGSTLVLSSMYKLGIYGTYMGDHFGIFLKERVVSFPFNVTRNPMYTGSTLVFCSVALNQGSFAGLFMSLWVFVFYQGALFFEESFTERIYNGLKSSKVRREIFKEIEKMRRD